jgi:HSP20 family protein
MLLGKRQLFISRELSRSEWETLRGCEWPQIPFHYQIGASEAWHISCDLIEKLSHQTSTSFIRACQSSGKERGIMQSQRALELKEKTESTRPLFVEAEKLLEQMKEFSQAISHRAYEFFETRGRELGHELEDWFRAESEVLRRVPVEIQESDKQLIVRAELPGFSASEIQVNVEPRRLSISGKVEPTAESTAEKAVYTDRRPNRFCRLLDLPAEVDPRQAAASLKNGILELTLPKAAASEVIQVEVKSA